MDEADRMLSMDFEESLDKILQVLQYIPSVVTVCIESVLEQCHRRMRAVPRIHRCVVPFTDSIFRASARRTCTARR
jgi:hypothetical protein